MRHSGSGRGGPKAESSSQTELVVRMHEEVGEYLRGITVLLENVRRALGLISSSDNLGTLAELRELSIREWEVLREMLDGHRVSRIASSLCISPHTVRNHAKSIYHKLGVRSQLELVLRFRALTTRPHLESPDQARGLPMSHEG